MKGTRLYLGIIFFIGTLGSTSYANNYLDEQAIAVYLNTKATVYSKQGWDWKKYTAELKKNNTLLPKRLGFPQKHQKAYSLLSVVEEEGGKFVSYDKISYRNKSGDQVIGWVLGSSVTQDLNELNKPSKTVREVLGIDEDPNNRSVKPDQTEADICIEGCKESHNSSLSNIGEYIDSIASLKNTEDLEWYMNIYRKGCKDKYHEKYVTKYRQYIEAASENFGVPEALLTCLLFRESQFDPNASSFSKVEGIAQITGGSVNTINRIISSGQMSEKRKKKYKKIIECGPNIKKWDLSCRKNGYVGSKKETLKGYWYAKSMIEDVVPLADRWKTYFERIESFSDYQDDYMNNKKRYRNYETPTAFTKKLGNKYPPNAIGASALYLKTILEGIQERTDGRLDTESAKEALIVTAGAYNAGPGNVWNKIEGDDPSRWKSQILDAYAKEKKEAKPEYIKAKKNYNWVRKAQIPKKRKELKAKGLSDAQIEKHSDMKKLKANEKRYKKVYQKLLSKMNKADEVEAHMNSIGNCMESGNEKAPSGTNNSCEYLEVK